MVEAPRRVLVTWCSASALVVLLVGDEPRSVDRACWDLGFYPRARAQDQASGRTERSSPGAAGSAPLDLRPRSAARSLLWDEAALPSETSSPATTTASDDPQTENRLAADVPRLSRVAHEDTTTRVTHAVQDLTGALLRPWQLLLAPLRAARYRYRGDRFDAVIRADGRVAYRSKAGPHVAVTPVQAERTEPRGPRRGSTDNGGPARLPGFGLAAGDPRRWIDKLAGDDPDAAERRSFLERTRALRELLRERARREAQRRADAWLDQTLARIVAGSAEPPHKHDAVFRLWDACADDEIGEVGRARIEAFVRVHCPPGSECGLSPADLARLNADRLTRRRFDPYAPPASARAERAE